MGIGAGSMREGFIGLKKVQNACHFAICAFCGLREGTLHGKGCAAIARQPAVHGSFVVLSALAPAGATQACCWPRLRSSSSCMVPCSVAALSFNCRLARSTAGQFALPLLQPPWDAPLRSLTHRPVANEWCSENDAACLRGWLCCEQGITQRLPAP